MLPPIRALPDTEEIDLPIETPLVGPDIQTIRILHVDDDGDFLDLSATMLGREDDRFEVWSEPSATAGLDRLERESIDCVVSDFQMPEIGGLEFLDRVRDRHPDLPFILFTGKGSEEIASEAITRGVTDYLQKGGGTHRYAVLANRIRNAVGSHRTYDDLLTTLTWYQRLVEQDIAGIYVVQDDAFVYVNPKFADLFGYDQEELVGQSVYSIVAEDDRATVQENLRRRERGETDSIRYAWTGVTETGRPLDVEVQGGTVEFREETAILGVLVEADHDD